MLVELELGVVVLVGKVEVSVVMVGVIVELVVRVSIQVLLPEFRLLAETG